VNTDYRGVLEVLEREAKEPQGITAEVMEELRRCIGTELSFVDGINMIAAALKNKDTAEAVTQAAEQQKEDTFIFYDVKKVAEKLECSIPTAREIMNRKDFPSLKVANSMRVSRPAFEEWTMQKRA